MSSRPGRRNTATGHGLELLSRRDHFAAELVNRLAEAGFSDTEIEEALGSLRSGGLLDDRRLAVHCVRRWRGEGRSEAECRARLKARGADSAAVEEGLRTHPDEDRQGDPDGDPELDAAIRTLGKAIGSGTRTPSPERLAARLGRRGFEPDTIRAALRHYGLEDSDCDSSDPETAP